MRIGLTYQVYLATAGYQVNTACWLLCPVPSRNATVTDPGFRPRTLYPTSWSKMSAVWMAPLALLSGRKIACSRKRLMKQRSRERTVEGIAPPESANSGFAASRRTLRVLCLLVLLYIPVQWIIGRPPGSTSIVSWQQRELERQFREADFALRQQLLSQCP